MITVKDVLGKGFDFVEGDQLRVRYDMTTVGYEYVKKAIKSGQHNKLVASEFAWRKNTGSMPCDGELLIDVKFYDGEKSIHPMPADSYDYGVASERNQITYWKPSLKNWESEMNVDNIESTEQEEEAFKAMGKDVEWDVLHGDAWIPCIRLGVDIYGNYAYQLADGEFKGEFNGTPYLSNFRKHETREQKAEREWLENGRALWMKQQEVLFDRKIIPSKQNQAWDKGGVYKCERETWCMLAEKIGYRKGNNNE